MPAKCQCSQCGSTDFKKEASLNNEVGHGEVFLRCAHCNSLYKMQSPEENTQPKVVIQGGANVIFGKSSKVTIAGGLLVENGAHVEFLGTLDIIEKSPEEKIREAREFLKLSKDK